MDASKRDAVLDALHYNIYKAFQAAGIEIPYSKHDVYLKEVPERLLGQPRPSGDDRAARGP